MRESKTKDHLDWLTDKTSRSVGQTKMLLELVDNDFEKLVDLEVKIKECFLSYCPSDKESVKEVMDMESKSKWNLNTREYEN